MIDGINSKSIDADGINSNRYSSNAGPADGINSKSAGIDHRPPGINAGTAVI